MQLTQQYIAFRTILRREVVRFIRIWSQTLLPPVITTTLYFLIFGALIGPRIGQIDGFSYMEYIVPGLIMLSIITNSYANVVGSFFGSKFQRNVEEMLVSSMPHYIIVLGFAAGGVARGLCVGVIVTVVSAFFIDLQIQHFGLVISIATLTAMLFALAGLINAVFANSFDDINIVPTFVLTPLTYLGGIFYSISMLPDIWQHVSLLNPILYMVNGFRYAILGVSDVNLWACFGLIIGLVIALFCVSLYLLQKGIGLKA